MNHWLCGLLLVVASGDAVHADGILIRGATVHTASARGTLQNTDVLVQGGKIAAVGSALTAPPGTTLIEANGRALTPGLFAGVGTIGLEEVQEEPTTVDATLNSKSPGWEQQWRPEFDVMVAYNPRSVLLPVARIEGLTWTVLSPGSGDTIMAGQGGAVLLDGRRPGAAIAARTLFIQMGSAGAAATGGTRAGEFMLLDQAMREARSTGAPGPGALLHAAGRETLAHYLAGGRVVFQVDRAADIVEVIGLARRSGMKAIILGGDEAWLVASELAAADVPVILDPLDDLPVDFDRLASTHENAARLHHAGVRIAFSTGDSHNARLVRQLAGNAVAHGLPWETALAAITSSPADIFGLGAVRGRVAVGQAADLVLWSGDPLEVSTLADQVWIGGRAIDMRSRQTELRDRYMIKLKAHQAR